MMGQEPPQEGIVTKQHDDTVSGLKVRWYSDETVPVPVKAIVRIATEWPK